MRQLFVTKVKSYVKSEEQLREFLSRNRDTQRIRRILSVNVQIYSRYAQTRHYSTERIVCFLDPEISKKEYTKCAPEKRVTLQTVYTRYVESYV